MTLMMLEFCLSIVSTVVEKIRSPIWSLIGPVRGIVVLESEDAILKDVNME